MIGKRSTYFLRWHSRRDETLKEEVAAEEWSRGQNGRPGGWNRRKVKPRMSGRGWGRDRTRLGDQRGRRGRRTTEMRRGKVRQRDLSLRSFVSSERHPKGGLEFIRAWGMRLTAGIVISRTLFIDLRQNERHRIGPSTSLKLLVALTVLLYRIYAPPSYASGIIQTATGIILFHFEMIE